MIWVSGRPDGHVRGKLRADDGVLIPYRSWIHPEPSAVICYMHGLGDHSGPFAAMGDLLHGQGFSVYAHDHRGFGLSDERRGDITTYDRFVDDAEAVLALARAKHPGKPVFLMGHSMGGHVALRTAYRAQSWLSGVIALSPGFRLKAKPPGRLLTKTIWQILTAPEAYVVADLPSVTTTRNALHNERALQDEYYVRTLTARFYLASLRSLRRAMRELTDLTLPVLVLQAGADELVSPEGNRQVFGRIGSPDRQFRLMEGLCHNMVVEPEMPEVATAVADWVRARI